MTLSKIQNWLKQVFFFCNDTSSTTRPHYVIVENGASSPGRAADGRAQQSGWHNTETAAPNWGERNTSPVMTGDKEAGCWYILIRTGGILLCNFLTLLLKNLPSSTDLNKLEQSHKHTCYKSKRGAWIWVEWWVLTWCFTHFFLLYGSYGEKRMCFPLHLWVVQSSCSVVSDLEAFVPSLPAFGCLLCVLLYWVPCRDWLYKVQIILAVEQKRRTLWATTLSHSECSRAGGKLGFSVHSHVTSSVETNVDFRHIYIIVVVQSK